MSKMNRRKLATITILTAMLCSRAVLNLCEFTGKWTMIIGAFFGKWSWRSAKFLAKTAFRTLAFVFHHTLSMHAMRRHKRWTVNTFWFIDRTGKGFAEWVVNVIYLRGKIGLIQFDVEDEMRDGYLVLREFGNERMVPMNFWCENRYIVRKGHISRANLNLLMTQALEHGYKVAFVHWGEKQLKPYDLPPIGLIRKPEDVRLPWAMRWLEKPEPQGMGLRVHDIIQRVA